MYKPLHDYLEIRKSNIHGHGIFANQDIPAETDLGISHFMIFNYPETVRTPLGGFINHSKMSNCIRTNKLQSYSYNGEEGVHVCRIITKRNIKANEELTLTYQWYDPESLSSSPE
tara:strand:- start:807 stop:1151 length:345 start_codon:yes stop_codon:yes gene_type:complete